MNEKDANDVSNKLQELIKQEQINMNEKTNDVSNILDDGEVQKLASDVRILHLTD